MPEKFPHYGFAEYNIYRKLVCFLLGVTLIIVQSGCYTTSVTRLEQEELRAMPQQLVSLKKGQRVQITYTDSINVKQLKGIVQVVTTTDVEVVYNVPGMYKQEAMRISFKQIKSIEFFARKLKIVETTLVVAIPIIVIGVITSIAIAASKTTN